MKALSKSTVLLLPAIFLLSGCFPDNEKKDDVGVVVEHKIILAKVNEEAITDESVNLVINQTFANNPLVHSNPELRQKVLASLVSSKAMKLVAEQELSQARLAEINVKTQHYKEELLVKEYLQLHAVPEPVTTTMINDYYQSNLEQFGKVDVKTVEILQRKLKTTEKERDELLNKQDLILADKNWQLFANKTNKQLGLSYLKTKVSPGLLAKTLEETVDKLNVGESSNILFVQERPYLIRVTDVTSIPAKPLSSVRLSIRKKLAALQLKKAVKKSAKAVLENVSVEYMELND